MKELVECFIAWLQAEPATNNAWKILDALARETLKRVESPDAEQREFDAAQLAEVCRPGEVLDYENAKKWFVDAKVLQFINARRSNLEAFFVAKGHEQCLFLDKRASGGRHKSVWFLKTYEPISALGNEPSHRESSEGLDEDINQIQYSVTEPGAIQLSKFGKLILGTGEFKTRSWRGGLWAFGLVCLSLLLIFCGLLVFQMRTVYRPLQTNDLVVLVLLCSYGWIIWRLQIRPLIWLLEDRIGFASDALIKLSEDAAHLDMAKNGAHRYIRLVRYSAVCPICAGTVELRYGKGANRRRIFGCCTEVPNEHVFTFDRITRVGTRYIY
nr:hypothetical protein [uncultured Rhodoferax sp.]